MVAWRLRQFVGRSAAVNYKGHFPSVTLSSPPHATAAIIGLLREVCARGARSDLAVGVDETDPDSRTARRVIRMPRCPFSSMTGAFVPGGDPSSPAIVKRLTGGHVPGV